MSNEKMLISKVKVFGKQKDTSFVVFNKGLNLISGPSDTGKSYLFQLIDYLLGKKTPPKNIKQGNGYSQAVIELKVGQKDFSFIRDFDSSKAFFVDHTVDELVDTSKLKSLADKHTTGDKKDGISNLLLEFLNCPYKKIRKNEKDVLKAFTFRNFSHQVLLGEAHIFSDSPYYFDGQGALTETSNKESLLTVLSGCDDSSLLFKEKTVSAEKISGGIEELENQIEKNKSLLNKFDSSSDGNTENQVDKINSEISSLKNKISDYKSIISELEKEKVREYNFFTRANNEYYYSQKIFERLKLLEENYNSDLKRITFIDQSTYYFSQLDNFSCPICGSNTAEIGEDVGSIVQIEQKNLLTKLNGVQQALKDAKKDVEKLQEKKNNLESKIAKIDQTIEKELQPILSRIINRLESLLIQKSNFSGKNLVQQQIVSLEERLKELKTDQDSAKNPKTHNTEKKKKLIDFSKLTEYVEKLLREWKLFDEVNVQFNFDTFDLIINNEEKASFGKGYKALINSAFLIAIHQYTKEKELSFPSFIIIDSPLVAFSPKIEKSEGISAEVINCFYESLATHFEDSQVIIFENAVPENEIKNWNHIQFTKNTSHGRFGFYPVAANEQ